MMSVCDAAPFCAHAGPGNTRNTIAANVGQINRREVLDPRREAGDLFIVNLILGAHSLEEFGTQRLGFSAECTTTWNQAMGLPVIMPHRYRFGAFSAQN